MRLCHSKHLFILLLGDFAQLPTFMYLYENRFKYLWELQNPKELYINFPRIKDQHIPRWPIE